MAFERMFDCTGQRPGATNRCSLITDAEGAHAGGLPLTEADFIFDSVEKTNQKVNCTTTSDKEYFKVIVDLI